MTATTDTPVRQLELVHVRPGALLLDRNVRLHTNADEDLVESIRTHGVLQPSVAVRTADGGHDGDGELRVKFGHRRTIAALAAELDEVPVIVAGDEATDDPGHIDRVLEQIAENDAREGLTQLDRVHAVEQLTAFGLTADQIAARTKRPVAQVKAAQIVAGSEQARGMLLARPGLDLVHAATLAEFDDDPNAQGAALAIIQSGYGIEHRLQRLRDDRRERSLLVAAAEKLGELGVRVAEGTSFRRLDGLSMTAADVPNSITPEAHKDCPGHAAVVSWEYGDVDAAKLTPVAWEGTMLGGVTPLQDAPGSDGDAPCTVCGCDDDAPCTGGQDHDDDPNPDDTCYWWHEDVDPQNPGGNVCSYCVSPDGGVLEERRKVKVETVTLPGDDPEPVIVRGKWLAPEWVCTNPTGHGHVSKYGGPSGAPGAPKPKMADMAPAEQEKARAERKDVIDSNKAWKAATAVRVRWLREFLTRKTPPKGTGAFIASVLAERGPDLDGAMRKGNELAHDLLGLGSPEAGFTLRGKKVAYAAAKASDARAQVIALGFVLGCLESQTDTSTWRRKLPYEQAYFRFLAACGYELADVEQRVIDGKPEAAE
jgi:ParB family chromosome partitioning protein